MKENVKSTVMPFNKFVDMDVPVVELRLYPNAKEFLFEYFALLRRVFSDILGLLETDYISIALINPNGQLFFLSSKPSIEQNLIEKNLWPFDGSYQEDFIYQEQPKLWSELTHLKDADLIKKYKQINPKLINGISIPAEYLDYRIVVSFGFKKINPLIQNKKTDYCEKLLAMGKYCLQKIDEEILFPDKKYFRTKPKLELIINNQVIL